ncbi:keratin, type I cytoskeletal 47 kDa-like [Bufo bufo]|uniref:keratin, type I cytoskeletal 47 kDa-like n=1 Tax=Bufo bufo TaxID=8384 RepID=UPI001ABE8508|nr:keratin, type I cytoskeletal 47 kDa-like [Bufo bufo]
MKNAPATRLVNGLLEGQEEFAIAYLDDIAVFSNTWKEHLVHLSCVLDSLRRAGLTVKTSKCQLGMTEVQYLGHRVGSGKLSPNTGRFSGASTQRARSVAGGSGSIRMSTASVSMGAPIFNESQDAGLFSNNSKETMNNLNDRLAAYLERVRSLEQANSELECKIHEFYERKSSISAFDPSEFYKTINKLHSQILEATTDHVKMLLQIDIAKLAADDFKMKFESELAIRFGVENDTAGLGKVLDELTINCSDLELEIEGLKDLLIYLKIDHEEELTYLKGQIGGKVNVEADFSPSVDVSKILAVVREQYENVAKNRQEVENWYQTQVCKKSNKARLNSEYSRKEITELRRTSQSLEIELQSLLHMKQALEGTRAETNDRYGNELRKIQILISQNELELQQVRSDYENHSMEYRRLLDIKTRLEQDIATYRKGKT